MAKYLSETERRLQKKLIPLNIFVCILALVAAISLFLAPLIKVDVGKILGSDAVMEFAEDKLEEMVKNSGEVPEGEVDYAPVISAVVKNVMSNAEGDVTVTTLSAFKAAIAPTGTKGDVLTENLVYNGLIDKLIDSVAEGVANMFDTPQGKAVVEEAMVRAMTMQLAENLPEGVTADAKKLTSLTETLRNIDGKDRAGAQQVVSEFVGKLDGLFGSEYDIGASKQNISDFVMDMYDDTAAELEAKGRDVSFEAMICVGISKNADLSNFNLGELIKNMLPKDDGETPANGVRDELTEGDGETSGETPDEGGNETPVEPPITPPNVGDDAIICTNYPELLDAMGLGEDDVQSLKEDLKVSLRSMADEYIGEYKGYIDTYWYALFAPFVFIVPWLILFLFSFFHMLAKNKRFTMWYVKLYSLLPCLLFGVVPLVAPLVLPKIITMVGAELAAEQTALVLAVLKGISSLTWISGGCYVLLWLVSIFWAFPIKRKIRKERKYCKAAMKNGTYTYDYGAYGDGGKGKKRGKNKKGKGGYAPDGYGEAYGYGGDSYGGDYGSDLGAGYGGYGSGGYDDGGFDDDYDYDSFGYPPYDGYGSSYGSLYDDEDDDF